MQITSYDFHSSHSYILKPILHPRINITYDIFLIYYFKFNYFLETEDHFQHLLCDDICKFVAYK